MTNNHLFKLHKNFVGDMTDELTFGYTMRHGGQSAYPENSFNMALYIGDDSKNVHAHQEQLAGEINFPVSSWVLPIQKHGGNIEEVTSADSGTNIKTLGSSLYDVDGLYTYERGVLLTMNYADCIPVYVYSVTDTFTGLAHAGWRGTSESITKKLIDCYKGSKEDLRVIIGVGINKSFYEVDDRVIDALKPLPDSSYEQTKTGWQLDLKEVNKHQALSAGIYEKHISVTGLGTESDEFFSFRMEQGQTGRALAFIGRRNND
ncbi:Laccase domain protein [Jeotgalicoccus saudimassiliensis]|uniref:Laccase domain protein n=1 Tax=Jeotgalicoccus saudimassiliensis TaxID=1461582 RepID=A0A078LZH2_9STAP|nr:polyphenol oxidase family protein [Jeotgalicoccus saudimassiliensis]CDZ99424.1 Laccase domain protein [Jeotgalicoccus saudimassiliensis]